MHKKLLSIYSVQLNGRKTAWAEPEILVTLFLQFIFRFISFRDGGITQLYFVLKNEK